MYKKHVDFTKSEGKFGGVG